MKIHRDWLILGGVALQVLVLGSIIGARRLIGAETLHHSQSPKRRVADIHTVLRPGTVPPDKIAKVFYLVEFGDYECPPCARISRRVEELQLEYPTELRFQFRHYPLQDMHRNALSAALLAESARRNEKFEAVHAALYERDALLTGDVLQSIRKQYALGTPDESDLQAVRRDIADAKKVGVTGTPTFLLCTPYGEVLELGSIDQVREYL